MAILIFMFQNNRLLTNATMFDSPEQRGKQPRCHRSNASRIGSESWFSKGKPELLNSPEAAV
jgi:hypothetical protein